jgi:putative PIN family toxin of toxin-antitoxin system
MPEPVPAANLPVPAPRVVLDTNVLYAGLYSSTGKSYLVLRAIADGRLRIVLSTPLLFEYEDVLKRNQAVLGLNDAEVDAVLDGLCALADFQVVYFLWRPCLPDAKDDMVLELAVAAQVRRIASFNAKDFRPAALFGIDIVSPKALLESLP